MSVAKTPHVRPKQVSRWLTGFGILNLSVVPGSGSIAGLKGVDVIVSAYRNSVGTVPALLRALDGRAPTTIRIVPEPGDDVEASIVSMRLDHFAPFLEAYVEKYAHRVYGEDH